MSYENETLGSRRTDRKICTEGEELDNSDTLEHAVKSVTDSKKNRGKY
jgi:hypothetical protein